MASRNRIIYLRADALKIHPIAQRRLSPVHLKRIMDTLDLDAIGPIHAVEYEINGDPGPWVVDGQHRITALLRLGFGEWKVAVVIHDSCKDDAGASKLFLELNSRAVVGAYDRYLNELASLDSVAMDIKAIAERHGYKIGNQARDGYLACIGSLKRIYPRDKGATYDRTLEINRAAFGLTADSCEGKYLEGLAIVIGTFDGTIDDVILTKKLAKYPGGASGIVGDGKGLKRVRRVSLPRCIAETIVFAYNKGRRSGALDF